MAIIHIRLRRRRSSRLIITSRVVVVLLLLLNRPVLSRLDRHAKLRKILTRKLQRDLDRVKDAGGLEENLVDLFE